MVALGVLVPLLDRGERVGGFAFESEHDAATCLRGHDHTVCTQFGSNHQILNDAPRHGTVSDEPVAQAPLVDRLVFAQLDRTPHRSRAPPVG